VDPEITRTPGINAGSHRRREDDSIALGREQWEIAIKWRIGKLPLPEPPRVDIPDRMQRSAIQPLPVLHSHALAVAELPGHHADPFDRLLVAHALLEGIALVTSDPALRAYDAELIWVG
jgi:PIN domain nuclease of toxin-antitoxin system